MESVPFADGRVLEAVTASWRLALGHEPQSRKIQRESGCWWRKNLGLERARATKYSSRQCEASEECPLCTKKPCSGSSPARRLECWLLSEATDRVIKQYSCFWLRQCLGLQWANAQECTHIVRARDVESVLFAEQDMFWKQSSTASWYFVMSNDKDLPSRWWRMN
jgi:hypothetical protein